MAAVDQQLRKGVLEILVLKVIASGDVYGYELIKQLETVSGGYFTLKEGSLYPVMYRLEDKGFIESYRKETEGKRGVPRKYYTITDSGTSNLRDMLKMWQQFKETVEVVLSKEVV